MDINEQAQTLYDLRFVLLTGMAVGFMAVALYLWDENKRLRHPCKGCQEDLIYRVYPYSGSHEQSATFTGDSESLSNGGNSDT